ncbi:MAG: FmdB family zinc ribbon protein [Actinomycetota bacterium]
MPTYAYVCTACGHRFDAVQSFSERALSVCPQCEGALRKEYGSIGVTFNGSGFYRTDSRAGAGGKKDASASSKSDSSTSAAPASTSSPASS